jgi:hypothetical protein
LKLQDHGNPVRYRNIWYRPLPPRASDGGSGGAMTPQAAAAKKKEIATGIRTAAAKKEGSAKLLGLMESLCYEKDEATQKEVEAMSATWLEGIKKTAPADIESKKGEIMHVFGPVKYMVRWKFLPETFPAKVEIEKIIKDNGWDKEKKK